MPVQIEVSETSPAVYVRRSAVALAVGALDPTGRAGVLADARAFAARGVRAAVLPVFVGNVSLAPEQLEETWDDVKADLPLDAVKLGRLGGERNVRVIAERAATLTDAAIVVDPEFLDPNGEPRISDAVALAWRTHILPLARVVIVNAVEATRLFARRCEDRRGMLEAAKRLFDCGPTWVVVTGGRLESHHAVDLVYDGTGSFELGDDRVPGLRLPHTGGTFSAFVSAELARGETVPRALERSRAALNATLTGAAQLLQHGSAVEPFAETYAALGLDAAPIRVLVPSSPKSESSSATP